MLKNHGPGGCCCGEWTFDWYVGVAPAVPPPYEPTDGTPRWGRVSCVELANAQYRHIDFWSGHVTVPESSNFAIESIDAADDPVNKTIISTMIGGNLISAELVISHELRDATPVSDAGYYLVLYDVLGERQLGRKFLDYPLGNMGGLWDGSPMLLWASDEHHDQPDGGGDLGWGLITKGLVNFTYTAYPVPETDFGELIEVHLPISGNTEGSYSYRAFSMARMSEINNNPGIELESQYWHWVESVRPIMPQIVSRTDWPMVCTVQRNRYGGGYYPPPDAPPIGNINLPDLTDCTAYHWIEFGKTDLVVEGGTFLGPDEVYASGPDPNQLGDLVLNPTVLYRREFTSSGYFDSSFQFPRPPPGSDVIQDGLQGSWINAEIYGGSVLGVIKVAQVGYDSQGELETVRDVILLRDTHVLDSYRLEPGDVGPSPNFIYKNPWASSLHITHETNHSVVSKFKLDATDDVERWYLQIYDGIYLIYSKTFLDMTISPARIIGSSDRWIYLQNCKVRSDEMLILTGDKYTCGAGTHISNWMVSHDGLEWMPCGERTAGSPSIVTASGHVAPNGVIGGWDCVKNSDALEAAQQGVPPDSVWGP